MPSNLFQSLLSDTAGERMLQTAMRNVAAAQAKEAKEQARLVKNQDKVYNDKLAILSDPKKLDALTASAYSELTPSAVKAKKASTYSTRVEAIDAAIPKDHPQYGRAQQFKDEYKSLLASSEYANVAANSLLLASVEKEKEIYQERAYKYKREADSSLLSDISFGLIDSEDAKLRRPEGYDQWLAKEQAANSSRFWSEDAITDPGKWLTDIATSAGIGGVAGAVVGGLGTGAAAAGTLAVAGGVAGAAVGGPIGAAIGAAAGGLMGLTSGGATGAAAGAAVGAGTFAAFGAGYKVTSALLHQSEWYAANESSEALTDRAQAMGADFGIGMVGGLAAERIGRRLLSKKTVQEAGHLLLEGTGGAKQIAYQKKLPPGTVVPESAEHKQLQHILPKQKGLPFFAPSDAPIAVSPLKLLEYSGIWPKAARTTKTGAVRLPYTGSGTPINLKGNAIRLGMPEYGKFTLPAMRQPPKKVSGMLTSVAGKQLPEATPTGGSMFDDYAMVARKLNGTPESYVFGKADPEKAMLILKPTVGTAPNALSKRAFHNLTVENQQRVVLLAGNKEFVKRYPGVDPMTSAIQDVQSAAINMEKAVSAEGAYTWTKKVTANIEAGKAVPKIHVYRGALEATDPFKVLDMQVSGKITLRQAEALKFNGDKLGKIKAKEAERLLKKVGLNPNKLMGIGVAAVGSVPVAGMLFDDAEAGIFTTAVAKIPKLFSKGLSKAAKEGQAAGFLKKLKDAGQAVIESPNPREMPIQFQQQLSVAEYSKKAYGSLMGGIEDVSGKTRGVMQKIMSPGFSGDLIQKTKARVAVQMMSAESAAANNAASTLRAFDAIAERVPGLKGFGKEIIKEMEPLALRYVNESAPYRHTVAEIGKIDSATAAMLKSLKKAKGAEADILKANMDKVAAERAALKTKRESYVEAYKVYTKDVTVKHQELAAKYPSVRVALAAEDTAEFTRQPWLKDLLTKEELEATSYIKNIFNTYRGRIKEVGHQTIDKQNYVHRPLHPSLPTNKIEMQKLSELGIIPGDTVPFTKFHTRGRFSKQLVPDIEHIMQRYVPDAEKRIQWTSFWKDWKQHAREVKNLPGHGDFWAGVEKAMKPAEATPLYQWSNRYYQFEVLRLIGFSGSAALKHLFKLEGTIANFGLKDTITKFPEAVGQANRLSKEYLSTMGIGKKLGWSADMSKTATDEIVNAHLGISRNRQTFAEMELDAGIANFAGMQSKADTILKKAAELSTFPIKWVEYVDRAHSVLAIRDLALAKKAGKELSATDAAYQTWDTMIKMNFVGGSLNPAWQRNPFVRTLFMFQNTPAKLLERRLVNAIKTKDAIVRTKDMVFDSYDKQVQALGELQGMMKYIKAGELEFKRGILNDAVSVMNSIKNPSGQSYYKQFISDLVISGGIIAGGGAMADADLAGHVFHFPFLKAHTEAPTLSLAPIVTGAYETMARKGEDGDDMLMTRFANNWLGKQQLIPQTMWKGMRINKGDIPEIYNDSWLKYFFSVPGKQEH